MSRRYRGGLTTSIFPRIVGRLRGGNAAKIFEGPIPKYLDWPCERSTNLGQFIVNTWRDRRRHGPRHQTVTFHVAQRRGEHSLRDAVDPAFEFIEPISSVAQHDDDQDCPFVTDAREHLRDPEAGCGFTPYDVLFDSDISHNFVPSVSKLCVLAGRSGQAHTITDATVGTWLIKFSTSTAASRALTRYRASYPHLSSRNFGGSEQHDVTYRDLVEEDLPHFTAVTAPSAHALSSAVSMLDQAQQAQRDESNVVLQ